MPGITEAAVDQYMLSLLPARGAVLEEMEEQARKRNIPIVGPAVGRVLFQYARLINAKKVFELGSAIGYSTLWWAQAVGEDGEIFYTDGDPKKADEARGYFERAGVAGHIHIGVGDALEQFAKQKQEFDIVFNDIDKEGYPRVLDLVASRLRRGGLFITDNVLWSGRVTQAQAKEESTRAIQEFNRRLYAMKDFFTTILPLRDGLAVAVKG
ncbi:MAG TPA: O-methyltransferase [Candidatus Angelobacter sp.]|nr:O-methyltransferase [Candidatus Angelobacter sp.]